MNHFRILLAILASFCAFFAYMSRLNLSLVIDYITPPKVDEVAPAIQEDGNRPDELWFKSPIISTIEHIDSCTTGSHVNRECKRKKAVRKMPMRIDDRDSSIHMKLSSKHEAALVSNLTRKRADASEIESITATPEDDADEQTQQPCYLDWNESQQNNILGAFFWGYLISQIPAARLAEMFGAKPLFLFVGLGSSLSSLLFPVVARVNSIGFYLAFSLRVFLGCTQGAMFPAVYVFFCQWLPKKERPKWLPFPSAFSRFGTIAMNTMVPIILDAFGWEAVFYFIGGAALVWCGLFLVFASSTPQDNYWISKDELVYIESHMEPQVGTLSQRSTVTASGFTINESSAAASKPPISWKKIFTNKAVLVMSLVMFSAEWSNAILLITLPKFLGKKGAFNMECQEIANWSSGMVVIFCVAYPFFGWLATKLDNSDYEWFTPIRVRKLFELTANLLQVVGCLTIAFNGNKYVVLASLYLMMVGRSIVGGGQCLMPPELSRDFSGTVFAFSNTIANVAGILGPKMIDWTVRNRTQHSDWFYFFIIGAIVFTVAATIFCLLAENDQQNFTKKPKTSMSQAQLNIDMQPEEIYKMEAFSRVSSEPNPRIANYPKID